MINKVAKNKKELSQFILDELAKNEMNIFAGDKVIDDDGGIFEVEKIYEEERNDWHDEDGKKRKKPIVSYVVMISFGYWRTDDETGKRELNHYGSNELEKFKKKYIKLTKPVEELKREAIDSLLKEEEPDEESQSVSSETALVHGGSKEHLVAMKNSIEKKREFMEVKMRMLQRVLNAKKGELNIILRDFEKKIETIRKVIYTIELYLGINEEVMLLQDGERAPITAPICFRQEILYMDEEVGDPEDDGLDFRKIDDFDSWLLKNKNYKKIIPETKGVIIMRVRRKDKHYDSNPFVNSMMNEDNMMTYILIRNGDRICRIWADIQIHPRLFPKRNELEKLFKNMNGEVTEDNFGGYVSPSDKEKAEKRIFRYKQQMIMLQGMIDRTELFHPLPSSEIKIASQESFDKNYVRFIYDDELRLPDGRLMFWEWHKKINKTIKEGARIIVSGKYGERYVTRKDFADRIIKSDMMWREQNYDLPKKGVYQVEKYDKIEYDIRRIKGKDFNENKVGKEYIVKTRYVWENDREVWMINKDGSKKKSIVESHLIIKYNPKDTIYKRYDSHDRKKRLSFIIEPDNDEFILNLDEVSLDDVEFYLNSRLNRQDYLWMMPCLYEIKKCRLAEKEFEKDFVKMMVGQLFKQSQNKKSMAELEQMIWTAVDWWKLKNKWKRGINKDDAKALRMIKRKIEKQLSV